MDISFIKDKKEYNKLHKIFELEAACDGLIKAGISYMSLKAYIDKKLPERTHLYAPLTEEDRKLIGQIEEKFSRYIQRLASCCINDSDADA